MAIGDTIIALVHCTDSAGADLSLTKATFDAKYTITWRRNGASYTAPTYTITDVGEGWHELAWTAASGVTELIFTEDGTDLIDPSAFQTDEEQSYDLDSIGSLFATTGTSATGANFVDESLGQIVEGDSYRSAVLTIASSKFTTFGYTDLDDIDTLTVKAKQVESDTAVSFTATIISAAARTVQLEWDTFPAGLARTATDGSPETWYIDLQGDITGPPAQVLTLGRYTFDIIWDRND